MYFWAHRMWARVFLVVLIASIYMRARKSYKVTIWNCYCWWYVTAKPLVRLLYVFVWSSSKDLVAMIGFQRIHCPRYSKEKNMIKWIIFFSISSSNAAVCGLSSAQSCWLSAEAYVVSAASKGRRVPFYRKWSFAALTSSIFLPLYKVFIRPYLEHARQVYSTFLPRDS